jgi:hypothetical protein
MILTTAARNAACNAVVDLLDAGAGAGYIEFQTSGDVEVATLPMSDPAFGAAAAGVATAGAITSDTNATGGTIEHAKFFDSNDTECFEMTCGTSGSEINLSSLAIGVGDTVAISSLTVNCPAS